jgi:hypothetical protein
MHTLLNPTVQSLLSQLIPAIAVAVVAFLARDAFRSWLADRSAERVGRRAEDDIRKQLIWLEEHYGGRLERVETQLTALAQPLGELTTWGETVDARLTERASEFRMAIAEWGEALRAVEANVDKKIQHAQSRVDGSVAAVHELGTSSWRKPG